MRFGKITAGVALSSGLALLGNGPALAADPPVQSAVTPKSAVTTIKNDPGKRICKQVTPTGTRMGQRVCKTALDWQLDLEAAQRDIDDNSRAVREFPCSGTCPE